MEFWCLPAKSGVGRLAVVDGLLYVEATTNVIYRFDGKTLLDALAYDHAAWEAGDRTYKDLEKQIDASNAEPRSFTLSANRKSVERIHEDGSRTPVELPSTAQGAERKLLLLTLVCVLGLITAILKKKDREEFQ